MSSIRLQECNSQDSWVSI